MFAVLSQNQLCRNFWAKASPFGAPGDPEEAQYQAKVCGVHGSNSGGPIGCSWDQIWLPGVLCPNNCVNSNDNDDDDRRV